MITSKPHDNIQYVSSWNRWATLLTIWMRACPITLLWINFSKPVLVYLALTLLSSIASYQQANISLLNRKGRRWKQRRCSRWSLSPIHGNEFSSFQIMYLKKPLLAARSMCYRTSLVDIRPPRKNNIHISNEMWLIWLSVNYSDCHHDWNPI